MRRIKYFIALILSIMIVLPNVYAEEKKVTFTHEQQNVINDNGELIGVELTMSFQGSDVVAIQHDIEFDSEKLNLKEVTANGSFTLTQGELKKKGKKTSTTMVIDGEYAYSNAPYLKMYFEFTDKFVNYSTALIRFTNVKSAGLAEKLIKMNGKEISLTITGNNMLSATAVDIDEKFTINEWIEQNKTYLYIAGGVILVLIILDILYVSFKNRKQDTPFNTNAKFIDNNAKHLRNSFTETQENENKQNGIDPDKYKYKSIILFMLALSILSIGTVIAVQGQKNQDIRDYIVGKKGSLKKEDLDISGDGEIDVLDLVFEKNVKDYKIIKINEWNTEFLRNMDLYFMDLYHSQIPLEVYSVEYNVPKHITYTTTYDINAMECENGKIENFKKIDNNVSWTYEFDYTLTEGTDKCYMQAVASN
jgi:hypothetical protein